MDGRVIGVHAGGKIALRERQFCAVHIGMRSGFENMNSWHVAVLRYVTGDSLRKRTGNAFNLL